MSRGVTLSPKHGVNPSLGVCFWCRKDDGTVLLVGRINKTIRGEHDPEAPRRMVASLEPCDNCKALMARGITLMEAHEPAPGQMPEPTGRWFVMTEDAVTRIFDAEAAQAALRHRKAWISIEAVERLGLLKIEPVDKENSVWEQPS
jgi:hypothetical protein